MGTPNPTPERRALVTHAGIRNVDAIAEGSLRSGLQFYATIALVEGESRGKNIYGHDQGGFDSGYKELEVTLLNWHKFYAAVVVNNYRSNGVGPAQITYRGYFDQMLAQNLKPWDPADNITFGATLMKGNRDRVHSNWAEAGTLYNAGNLKSGVNKYGRDYAARVAKWKRAFGLPA